MSDPRAGSPGVPPAITGGPATGQFLGTFQQIGQTLNAILIAIQQLLGVRATAQVILSEIAPPPAPPSGAILYVSNVDHLAYIVDSVGHRVALT
jgi:hypothetical protein